MSLTITNIEHSALANRRVIFCDVAFDSSYPTGGEALAPATIGLQKIDMMMVPGKSGYSFEYDYTNSKLKAFTPTAAQAAVTADKITITASGAAAITDGQSCTVSADFRSAVDAAAADEVANTTDLSAVTTVKVMAIGY